MDLVCRTGRPTGSAPWDFCGMRRIVEKIPMWCTKTWRQPEVFEAPLPRTLQLIVLFPSSGSKYLRSHGEVVSGQPMNVLLFPILQAAQSVWRFSTTVRPSRLTGMM